MNNTTKKYHNYSAMSSAELYEMFNQCGFIVESAKDEDFIDCLDIPEIARSKRRGQTGFKEPSMRTVKKVADTIKYATETKIISHETAEFLICCCKEIDNTALLSLNTAMLKIARPATDGQKKAIAYYMQLASVFPEMESVKRKLQKIERLDFSIFNCASYAIKEFKAVMNGIYKEYPTKYQIERFCRAFKAYYKVDFEPKKCRFFRELDRDSITAVTEELEKKSKEFFDFFEEEQIENRDKERASWYSEETSESIEYAGWYGLIGEDFADEDLEKKKPLASQMASEIWDNLENDIK